MANKVVKEKQLTVTWHVDDLRISHMQDEAVEGFIGWLKERFAKVTVSRGKIHDYLGMIFDYSS